MPVSYCHEGKACQVMVNRNEGNVSQKSIWNGESTQEIIFVIGSKPILLLI